MGRLQMRPLPEVVPGLQTPAQAEPPHTFPSNNSTRSCCGHKENVNGSEWNESLGSSENTPQEWRPRQARVHTAKPGRAVGADARSGRVTGQSKRTNPTRRRDTAPRE